MPAQGVSTYAEPGDWGAYELNHYTLAHLAWDPAANEELARWLESHRERGVFLHHSRLTAERLLQSYGLAPRIRAAG